MAQQARLSVPRSIPVLRSTISTFRSVAPSLNREAFPQIPVFLQEPGAVHHVAGLGAGNDFGPRQDHAVPRVHETGQPGFRDPGHVDCPPVHRIDPGSNWNGDLFQVIER